MTTQQPASKPWRQGYPAESIAPSQTDAPPPAYPAQQPADPYPPARPMQETGPYQHLDNHGDPHRRHGVMQETEEELTEDEREEYEKGIITMNKAKNWRFWFRREWLWYYVVLVILVVLVALMVFFHHDIVNWLKPFVQRMENIKAGFCIPVAIMFALSFPPLFGNEIVMILVGIVWGLGKGFAIVAVGTILGETANYAVFKYWCRGRAERVARKNVNYACLSRTIEEGGIIMAWLVRLSVVPTHFTTIVFAVSGLPFWKFGIALIAGLPKQLLAVYVGVVLGNDGSSHLVSDLVFCASAVVSLGVLWYIYRKMTAVRKSVILDMRRDLQAKHVPVSDPPADVPSQVGGEQQEQGHGWGHLLHQQRQSSLQVAQEPLPPPGQADKINGNGTR